VVVLDKKGHPAGGLTQDDFRIFDNGHEQQIVHFVAASTAVSASTPAPSPLVIGNRPQTQAETSRTTTAILVDENMAHSVNAIDYRHGIQSARLEVLRFLKTLHPGDRVALSALRRGRVVVIHDYADDSASLAAAAKSLGEGLLQAGIPLEAGRTGQAGTHGGTGSEAVNNLRMFRMDKALKSIIRHLQGVPGRKNLIWISTTFPSTVTDFIPSLMAAERDAATPRPRAPLPTPPRIWTQSNNEGFVEIARRLRNANISIYPMDPQGLVGPLSLAGSGADSQYRPPHQMPSTFFLRQQWSAMDLLASETGGRAFYDTNVLSGHLRQVVDETRVAYVLGYYPGDDAWDGEYHKIEVKLKGDNLVALCRKGYFASDTELNSDPDTALREAAKSPLEGSAIGVTLNVPSNPLEWYRQEVVVKVDTRDLHFEQRDGMWKASLDLAFVQLGKDGRVVDGVKDRVELALHRETYDDAAAQGWFYPKSLGVNPGAEKLRVLVRDSASGATGSVSVPIRREN